MTTVRVAATKLDSGAKGKVWFFLWKEGQSDGFPRFDKGNPIARLAVSAASPTTEFPDVQSGTYAISSFHDEKETGKVETNFIGMPKCALGTSGSPSGFGPPSFEKCTFVVSGSPVQLTIELKKIF